MTRATAALLAGVLVLGAALSATACRRGDPDDPKQTDWRVVQLYGGPGSVQALAEPETVEVFRIDPVPHTPEAGVAFCGVHRITAGPFEVGAEDRAALSRLLRDAGTYDWRHTKSDPFRPTIGLRFSREVSRVDIALDLDSRMLTTHRQGRRIGVEDFDGAAEAIGAIVERAGAR